MAVTVLDYGKFVSPGTEYTETICEADIIASVAGAQGQPKCLIARVSGTEQITTLALPWIGFSGYVTFLPTGAFTGTTGGTSSITVGAIGKAFTAVASKALRLVYFPPTGLWYPSY